MTLTRTSRLTAQTGTPGTSAFTTTAFTPSANSILVVHLGFQTNGGTTGAATSVTMDAINGGGSSLGLTWTREISIEHSLDAGNYDAIFWAPVGASPVSTRLVFDCGTFNIFTVCIAAVDYTGYDVASPIGVKASNTNMGTSGAQSITLSGAPAATSEIIGGRFANASSSQTNGATQGTGYTEIDDNAIFDTFGVQMQARPAGSTSTSFSWVNISTPSSPSADCLGVAMEIKEAAGAPTGSFYWGIRAK